MKKIQHPVAKPLSLAVAAALTGLGLAMTLVAPVQADTVVSSPQGSIYSSGVQNITVTSTGTISGGLSGIRNVSGTIGTLNNSGSISGLTYGINNHTGATIGTLLNQGSISAGGGTSSFSVYTNGRIGVLNNSGIISGATYQVYVDISGTIGTLNNSGTISGGTAGIFNSSGTIDTLSNTGSISGDTGIRNTGGIGTLSNTGTISGGNTGIYNNGSIGTLSNNGTISGSSVGIVNEGSIGTLSNSGHISGGGSGIFNDGTIGTLSNNGTISSTNGTGIYNTGTIGTLTNTGSISGVNYGIYNTGTIATLVNTGTISAGNSYYDIKNSGTITTLTNGQSGLTYTGAMPTNYNTYFASASSYGTTVFTTPLGYITSYGIQLAPTGVRLTPGTVYNAVLSSPSYAFAVQNANTVLSYSANGYSVTYELVAGTGYSYNLDIISFSYSGGSSSSNPAGGTITPAVLAQHNNPAYYAARVIDGSSTMSTLFSGVSGTAAQSAAASQSLPLVTGGATSVTQTALTSVNTIIDARQSANRGASSGDDFQTSRNMWLKAFGTEADQSDLDGVSGFKAHTGGVTFGADQKINDKLTLGAAFAYANSNVSSTVGGASHGINIKGYQLIGYGSLALNNRDSVDFQLDSGMSNNSGSRSISFLNETASSSYDSWSAHLGSSLNHRYELSDRLTLTPSLRVDYTRINESGYQESGANDLDLNVNSQKAEALVFGVDGKLDYKLNDTLALAANLGVGYDAMNKQDSIVAAYAGAPNASFITEGLNQGALVSRAGILLNYKLQKGMEISAHYDVEARHNYLSQTASVKFSMPF